MDTDLPMLANTYSPPASASAEAEKPSTLTRSKTLNDPFREESSSSTALHQGSRSSKHALLGQFSFAPATQTTVVTTTTTTTTNFPPLLLKAPKGLHDPDPRLYPLAASPTPQYIKELRFQLGGKPTIFREADDAAETMLGVSEWAG